MRDNKHCGRAPEGAALAQTVKRSEPGRDLLDPDGLWRDPELWDNVHPAPLAQADATKRADLLLLVAEWSRWNPNPAVRQGGDLLFRAIEAHLEGEPVGRALGLEPPAGLIARQGIKLARRNTLLRRARASVPAWRGAPTKDAARAMAAAFDRYEAGGWLADRSRETAPAAEPTASWWRILKLDLSHPMPREKRLAQILAEAK